MALQRFHLMPPINREEKEQTTLLFSIMTGEGCTGMYLLVGATVEPWEGTVSLGTQKDKSSIKAASTKTDPF